MSDQQTRILRDIALIAQLACDSHKLRPRRVAELRRLIAQLELPVTKVRAKALREHVLQSCDATRADIQLHEDGLLLIETPCIINIDDLNKRVLW